MQRKGIILAGGTGSRLFPITHGVSKQLLPIYNKPMVYYPLSTLMMADIRDIVIITTPKDRTQFEAALGDGSQWGINLSYISQDQPEGLAQAYLLAENFLGDAPSAMVLGDNFFYGGGLPTQLRKVSVQNDVSTVFGYHVSDPKRYGVIDFDKDGKVRGLAEKPEKPASNCAITGLYFLDNTASARAKAVKASPRGELEITDLLQTYLEDDKLQVEFLNRGHAWLDTGTFESLLDACNFVRMVETRQNLQICNPDEVAFRSGWITAEDIQRNAATYPDTSYKFYLLSLLSEI